MKNLAFCYVLIAICCLGWIGRTFGIEYAFPLTFLVGLPVILYIPISRREQVPHRREYVYLGIVTAIVLAVTPVLIDQWLHSFEYQVILFERDVEEFHQLIESEQRFSQVDVDHELVKGGHIYLKGTVQSKADHDELIHLANLACKHAASRYWDEVKIDELEKD